MGLTSTLSAINGNDELVLQEWKNALWLNHWMHLKHRKEYPDKPWYGETILTRELLIELATDLINDKDLDYPEPVDCGLVKSDKNSLSDYFLGIQKCLDYLHEAETVTGQVWILKYQGALNYDRRVMDAYMNKLSV